MVNHDKDFIGISGDWSGIYYRRRVSSNVARKSLLHMEPKFGKKHTFKLVDFEACHVWYCLMGKHPKIESPELLWITKCRSIFDWDPAMDFAAIGVYPQSGYLHAENYEWPLDQRVLTHCYPWMIFPTKSGTIIGFHPSCIAKSDYLSSFSPLKLVFCGIPNFWTNPGNHILYPLHNMVKFPVNIIPAPKNQRLHHKSHHSGNHILYIYICIYISTYISQSMGISGS